MGFKKCEQCKKQDAVICSKCHNEDKSESQNNIVVDHVLAYINTYRSRSSHLRLKLAVLAFYTEEEILEAKTQIIQSTGKTDIDVQQESTKRQNSQGRSAKEANFDDVWAIFEKLDQCMEQPKFVAEDVSRIPATSPEESGSVLSLMEAMSKMQKELQEIQRATVSIRQDVQHNSKILHEHGLSKRQQSNSMHASSLPVAISNEIGKNANEQVKVDNPTPSMADMVRRINVDNDGFQIRSRRNNMGASLPAGKTTFKQRSTQGTAEGVGHLKAGPETFKVQVTNVHPSITMDTICTYIQEKDAEVKLQDISDTSSHGWETKRFLLTFDQTAFEKVMDPSFWPPKIYYRQWYTAKPKPEGDKSSSATGISGSFASGSWAR